MEAVFHEKQEGSLCAQHCLNALLQGPYFTPVDLATLAQQMDDEERIRMAESGVDSDDYRRFLEQPSGNMDDSGYFSVQVISSALKVWGLELIPYNSTEPRAVQAQKNPAEMQAYICNYRDHWFTIRRLGNQWFNLNSLLSGPELISNTYLTMFLAQLQQEGYSIFVVSGKLPECAADDMLLVTPAVQKTRPRPVDQSDLQKAIRLSLGQGSDEDDGDEAKQLAEALRLSLSQDSDVKAPEVPSNVDSDEEEQLQQAMRLSLQTPDSDTDLERAIQMSLQASTTPVEMDAAEIRERRPVYMEKTGISAQQINT